MSRKHQRAAKRRAKAAAAAAEAAAQNTSPQTPALPRVGVDPYPLNGLDNTTQEQGLLKRAVKEGWIEPALLPEDRAKQVYDRLYIYAHGKSPTGGHVGDKLALEALKTLDKADGKARDRIVRREIGTVKNQQININGDVVAGGPTVIQIVEEVVDADHSEAAEIIEVAESVHIEPS